MNIKIQFLAALELVTNNISNLFKHFYCFATVLKCVGINWPLFWIKINLSLNSTEPSCVLIIEKN